MIKPIIYAGQSAEELFGAREEMTSKIEDKVKAIIADVRERGDEALRQYSERFDGFKGEAIEVKEEEFKRAFEEVSPELLKTLERSVINVKKFHAAQKREGFEIDEGDRIVGQRVTPVERAGIYVPGGTAAYPSTVIMNAVPAKIAGVKEIVMATPVKADGKVRAEVLVAAKLCGVDRVFKMGGAQAIAALAYGTETVPKVDKITGPGRDFVATAKKLVYGVACGIDMIAGPSEILVVADANSNPDWVAADLLSQAEHDVLATAILMTDSEKAARKTIERLYQRLKNLPRREVAEKSIENNCRIIVADSLERAVELANEYAPEHLELCVEEPFKLLKYVKNAGSVFLGYETPEAVGDYFAGANHTLPTSGTARFSSPLGVDDFVKTTQYIYYKHDALQKAADDIMAFAKAEGLEGHAKSVGARVGK